MHHLVGVFTLLLSQDNAYAVVALACGDVEMPFHRTTFTGIEVVLKPLIGPRPRFSHSLGTGIFHRVGTIGGTNGKGTIEFLLTVVEHHCLTTKVFALQHLDGDGRLAGGVYGQLLALATAINPFIAYGDVVESIIFVAAQTVQSIALNIVGPVILGIDAAIGQSVGGILNGVCLLLGLCHLAVRRNASVHAPVYIAVEERF